MTLDEAINKYYRTIHSLVYGRSSMDKEFADECSNDIFFLFWLKAENKVNDNAVFSWLLKVADYKLNNYIRKKKKEQKRLSIENIDTFTADNTELADLIIKDKDIEDAKEKILSLLSCEDRQMYEDYFVHKMSYKQIAEKLGVHRDTVSKRIGIITKKLTDEANKVFGITGAVVILQALSALLDK